MKQIAVLERLVKQVTFSTNFITCAEITHDGSSRRAAMSSAAFAIVTLVAHALSCSSVPYKVTRRASGPVASATSFTRRDLALGTAAIATALGYDRPAFAADEEFKTVVVAGATGQTGRRCLSRLGAMKGVKAIGGVRDPTKAAQKLAESKIEIRGAMIEKGASIDASSIELKALDVEKSSVAEMSATLKGADSLIIAVGFVPGNPFKMDAAAV